MVQVFATIFAMPRNEVHEKVVNRPFGRRDPLAKALDSREVDKGAERALLAGHQLDSPVVSFSLPPPHGRGKQLGRTTYSCGKRMGTAPGVMRALWQLK